jgi:hypothetical protein
VWSYLRNIMTAIDYFFFTKILHIIYPYFSEETFGWTLGFANHWEIFILKMSPQFAQWLWGHWHIATVTVRWAKGSRRWFVAKSAEYGGPVFTSMDVLLCWL